MKKLFVLLAALALAGCNLASGPGAAKPLTHVALTGAKGLFLQTGATSKGAHTVGKATTSSTTMLMQVMAGAQVGPATFTASDGSTVNVNIDVVLQVNASWLVVTYDTGGASTTAAVSISTGAMTPLAQVPNYFAQVRMLGSVAYFESGTTLYKMDFSTGAETTIGSGLAGNEYLHVTPAGDVYAYGGVIPVGWTWPEAWVFLAAGGTPATFQNAYGVSIYGSGPTVDGNVSTIEDQNTGDMWYISWGVPNIQVSKFVFNALSGNPGTPSIVSTSGSFVNARLGQQTYFQGALFAGATTTYAFSSDGAGGLACTAWNTSAVPQQSGLAYPGYWKWQTDGMNIYSAPCTDSQTINLVELPPGGGTATDPVLVSASGITSFAVTGGQVLYTTASGTYQQAATVGATATLYSGTPVSVAPVP